MVSSASSPGVKAARGNVVAAAVEMRSRRSREHDPAADVGEHDLQQRDAASVGREGVADAPPRGAAHPARTMLARHAAREAHETSYLADSAQHLDFRAWERLRLLHGGKLSLFSGKTEVPRIFSLFFPMSLGVWKIGKTKNGAVKPPRSVWYGGNASHT